MVAFFESFKKTGNLLKEVAQDESGAGVAPPAQMLAWIAAIAVAGGVLAYDIEGKEQLTAPQIEHAVGTNLNELTYPKGYIESAIDRHILDEHDIQELTLNLYFEARGEPLKGQMGVILVTLSRAVHHLGGSTVEQVVYAPNQFSWTRNKHNTLESVQDTDTFQAELEALSKTFLHQKLGDVRIALAAFTGLSFNTLFYKRTDLDMTTVSASTRDLFENQVVEDASIGAHTFYHPREKEKAEKQKATKTAPSPAAAQQPPHQHQAGSNRRV